LPLASSNSEKKIEEPDFDVATLIANDVIHNVTGVRLRPDQLNASYSQTKLLVVVD
jgi:hypothetical protein